MSELAQLRLLHPGWRDLLEVLIVAYALYRVLRLFHDSLARFGVLCLDRPLAVSDAYAGTYQAIEGDRPWYKRVG